MPVFYETLSETTFVKTKFFCQGVWVGVGRGVKKRKGYFKTCKPLGMRMEH